MLLSLKFTFFEINSVFDTKPYAVCVLGYIVLVPHYWIELFHLLATYKAFVVQLITSFVFVVLRLYLLVFLAFVFLVGLLSRIHTSIEHECLYLLQRSQA
jgi:hypothetical protein